jgi:Do/DeqQ family serine protease
MLMPRAALRLLTVLIAIVLAIPAVAQEERSVLENLLNNMLGEKQLPPSVKAQPLPAPAPSGKRLPFGREEMQLSFAPLVREAAPSVVNVYAARIVTRRSPFADDPFFGQFFGDEDAAPRRRMQSSLGSGVIVDSNGLVVTNNHVIANADEVKVALSDGREFECDILLKDERADLAILKIKDRQTFPALTLGDSDAIEVGDLVLAIGNPFGVGQTTTSGIISALARNQVGVSDFGFFIQTDAAINPGNSGGALLNMAGEVIGINTAIFSKSGGSVGIGFAIPSNMVRAVVESAEGGSKAFERPYIGETFEPVSSEIAESLGLGTPTGALVTKITRGSAADRAGLRVGDVVLKMDGIAVQHPDALGYRLSTRGIGKIAKFEVLSRNQRRTLQVLLEAAPASSPSDEQEVSGNNPFSGAVVSTLTPALADRLRVDTDREGVVVTKIKRGSPAMNVGIRPGDLLIELNGQEISSVEQVMAIVDSDPNYWSYKIDRGGRILRQYFR